MSLRFILQLYLLPAVPKSPDMAQMQQKGFINQTAGSPGGRLLSPPNLKAKATGPKSIRLNWDPPSGNPMGYKVRQINMFTSLSFSFAIGFVSQMLCVMISSR